MVNQNYEDSDNGQNAAPSPSKTFEIKNNYQETYNNSRIQLKNKPKRGG
jgi:hypothetical protein